MSQQYDSQHNPDNITTTAKKGRKKFIIIPIVLVIALVAATTFVLWPGNISREQAIEIAVAHVGGGTATWATHDFEEFRRTWEVPVLYDNLMIYVYVSRFTGQVVYMEFGGW